MKFKDNKAFNDSMQILWNERNIIIVIMTSSIAGSIVITASFSPETIFSFIWNILIVLTIDIFILLVILLVIYKNKLKEKVENEKAQQELFERCIEWNK